MTTLNLQVGANGNDWYIHSGATFVDGSRLYIGDAAGSIYDASTGARFTSVTVPVGATVSAADIQLFQDYTYTSLPVVGIYANAADNPAAPTTYAGASGLTLTSASTTWSPSTWSGFATSTDISAVIQEVVNRGSWTSGNAMIICANHTSAAGWSGVAKAVEMNARNLSSSNAPKLDITYTAGGAASGRIPIPMSRVAVHRAASF